MPSCRVAVVFAALFVRIAFAGEPPMTQDAAEKLARSRYFAFELAPVKASFKGDWVAFVKQKEADEAAAAKAWSPPRGLAGTPEMNRGHRALAAEFELVARERTDEVKALAKQVIDAALSGNLEPLVADCTMVDASAKDRADLTRKHFKAQAAEWKKAAKLAGTDLGASVRFTQPNPATGMPAMAHLSFGPPATKPKDGELYPARHEIELWWSGEVMPEANGPVHVAPTSPAPASRWRFHELVLPYSRRQMHLQ
jgi:hypothetical protein